MSPLLGLDYGPSRIGLAISDETERIAFPLGTHHTATDGSFFSYLKSLIRERDVSGLILGLPLTADGREAEMAGQVRLFAEKLAAEILAPSLIVTGPFQSRASCAVCSSASAHCWACCPKPLMLPY